MKDDSVTENTEEASLGESYYGVESGCTPSETVTTTWDDFVAGNIPFRSVPRPFPKPILLSTPEKCVVTADDPGARGSPDVVLTNSNDWKEGRWAVHGTNWNDKHVFRSRWIQLDWEVPVLLCRVVIDWETAFSNHYELQARESSDFPWETLVVTTPQNPNIVSQSWGTSPTGGNPLHYVDDVDVPFSKPVTSVRIFVHNDMRKNGYLSMWQIQVFGYECSAYADEDPCFLRSQPIRLTNDSNLAHVTASHGEGISHTLESGTTLSNRWTVTVGRGAWVRLDFCDSVLVTKVELDWSKFTGRDYLLQVWSENEWKTLQRFSNTSATPEPTGNCCETYHEIHHLKMPMVHQPAKSLRVYIDKPDPRLEVSLWQIHVYGYKL